MGDIGPRSSSEQQSLSGCNVLVVGGSSGIGAAVAKMAQALGADVTVGGNHPDRLAERSRQLGGCRTVQLNVGSRPSVEQALSEVGRIDHLVVTAGQRIVGRLVDQDPDQLLQSVQERIAGAVYVIRAALPHLSAEASITLTSGVLAQRPTADGTAVLAAAVAGVEGLARALALELVPRRVNVVSPGVTATALLDPLGSDVKARFLASVAGRLPVRRVGTPEELASAYVFLMCNGFATGQVLRLDGGGSLI